MIDKQIVAYHNRMFQCYPVLDFFLAKILKLLVAVYHEKGGFEDQGQKKLAGKQVMRDLLNFSWNKEGLFLFPGKGG